MVAPWCASAEVRVARNAIAPSTSSGGRPGSRRGAWRGRAPRHIWLPLGFSAGAPCPPGSGGVSAGRLTPVSSIQPAIPMKILASFGTGRRGFLSPGFPSRHVRNRADGAPRRQAALSAPGGAASRPHMALERPHIEADRDMAEVIRGHGPCTYLLVALLGLILLSPICRAV